MKATELKGRPVVSMGEAEKLGQIANVMLDVADGQVVALEVGSGLLGGTKTLLPGDVHNVGADAITVKSRDVLGSHVGGANLVGVNQLLGMKVVSEQGTLLGTLGDVDVDPGSWRINCYEMSGSLWERVRHNERTFNQAAGLRFGRDMLIVPDAVAEELTQRTGAAPGSPA